MKKQKLPNLVTVLILTLITVIMWVVFDVYRIVNKPSDPSVPAEVSEPINPTLDEETIKALENRIIFDDSQIPDNVVNPAISIPVQEIATSAAEPTSTPVPSQ